MEADGKKKRRFLHWKGRTSFSAKQCFSYNSTATERTLQFSRGSTPSVFCNAGGSTTYMTLAIGLPGSTVSNVLRPMGKNQIPKKLENGAIFFRSARNLLAEPVSSHKLPVCKVSSRNRLILMRHRKIGGFTLLSETPGLA